MKRNKAFTLIELVSVLVILAILALIVTPLVLNIIKKARTAADKRSIDAYGRSIELAVADYLLENGTFPTSIDQLTIEYSGDRVECSTTQLNDDSSVYLNGCTVSGRNVDYTYGEDNKTHAIYSIGDKVTYNGADYYVIKDSTSRESSVTLLKAEPLTTEEVNQYGSGFVNMHNTFGDRGEAYNRNGYGGIAYYTSETCGYDANNYPNHTKCVTNYSESDIKKLVDAWVNENVTSGLKEARLLKRDELEALGFEWVNVSTSEDVEMVLKKTENTPSWLYNDDYWYWTMSQFNDDAFKVWSVNYSGSLNSSSVDYRDGLVRPVIVLSKSALSN